MRRNSLLWICLAAALPLAAPAQEPAPIGAYFTVSVNPGGIPKLASVDYALWIPNRAAALRGVILRQHGCGNKTWPIGLNHVHDLQWQALARRHSMALMSSRYAAPDACESWSDMKGGSDRLFLEGLELLARQTGHPELTKVPWVLWGHSGGARWSGAMLLAYPARVAAAVLARCGETWGDNREAAQVPVLWAPGAKDHLERCISTPLRCYGEYRKLGALWTMAMDPVADHSLADHRAFAIPYLDAVLAQRLPAGARELQPMDPARAWLGDASTFRITPAADWRGEASDAVWLPDQQTARLWREFVTTGRVTPRRPLPEVEALQVKPLSATEVEITWKAEAGLESGLPSFAILRDGIVIGGVSGQSHGYHDDPSPVEPALRYRDSNLTAGRAYRYRVAPLAPGASAPFTMPEARTANEP